MIFPVRRCTFVIRYVFMLLVAVIITVSLFQFNLSLRVTNDVTIMRVKETRGPQISFTSEISRYVTPTKPPVTVRLLYNSTTLNVIGYDVNHHNFDYILNPSQLCNTSKIFLMIYVHSSPKNFKKRMSIRETWGHQTLLDKIHGRIVFVLGKVTKEDLMLAVKLEYNHYGDIVQEDFQDSYRNLSHKAIGAVKWVKHYCDHAQYVLKTDDDIFVNIYRLVHHIHNKLDTNHKSVTNLLLCNQWINMKVMRDEKSKWYLSKEEFPFKTFPTYCSGSAFLMSGDVASKMYNATLKTPFFWIDDYYFTGKVFQNLGIKHTQFNGAYSLNAYKAVEKFQNDTEKQKLIFFHTHKIRDIYHLWTLAQTERKPKRHL